MKFLIISCKEATFRLLKHEEFRLSLFALLQLWLHLAVCHWCRLFNKQNKKVNSLLKNIDTTVSLTEKEKELMQHKLKE
ncbi:MAG: hypothetical protein HYV28_18635 [Ignavibacteriales bacterium]|nr:hypothetical protein [Ignavibacteriales bacterium]